MSNQARGGRTIGCAQKYGRGAATEPVVSESCGAVKVLVAGSDLPTRL